LREDGSATHPIKHAIFQPGEIIRHRLFSYRGAIFDIDPDCNLSDEWYAAMARSCPPKDDPWYHVLVDGQHHTTYVEERNLEAEPDPAPVHHPEVSARFGKFESGRYRIARNAN
jgi:heat shock protein HspQ